MQRINPVQYNDRPQRVNLSLNKRQPMEDVVDVPVEDEDVVDVPVEDEAPIVDHEKAKTDAPPPPVGKE